MLLHTVNFAVFISNILALGAQEVLRRLLRV
jgi:hypothetical protein